MRQTIREFITYLHNVKQTSNNTEISYERDLNKMAVYLEEQGVLDLCQVTETDLDKYMGYLEKCRFAPSTISRSVASIRAFYQFLFKMRQIVQDPSEHLRPPKVEKKTPEILSVDEVDLLMRQPSGDSAKGLRDKAMLELLYATGMRVSELMHLEISDINLNLGYVDCSDGGKERIIPFGRMCRQALVQYLELGRAEFLRKGETEILFPNCSGRMMSRQGFWKVLKGYAASAGITTDITPHTLRHSFAAHMLQNGADIKSLQEMLGHSDVSTTQMYLNLNEQKMRDVYMKAHPRR
ncbi:MAG: site-specific tyrosine recombinase XerD [Blautia sp.]